MTIVKIVFVVLLCIPIACVSFFLFERLIDEYINVNKRNQMENDKVKHIGYYRKKKRRYY
ncbi:hypothetical protein [Sinanaerobacter sp. ZZT-01]|uniref:hypothetical protein n=1 Tax=Sinanaerobacter sp. ZZT-01 TaxID=3111540 RepID=UPI002D76E6E8|nr:hypothetical protein [Sinanaerobacter sp. ZZT-01]WRR92200.1 hypothetical protein U5921_08980 [Sinanaerobacter sp. ZZT-01]